MSLMGDDNEFAGISGYLAREDEDDPEFVGISRFAPKEYETRSPFVEGLKGVVEGFTDPEETRRQRQAYWRGSPLQGTNALSLPGLGRAAVRWMPGVGSVTEAQMQGEVGEPTSTAGKVYGHVADTVRTIGEFVLPMAGASLATKAGVGTKAAAAIANNPIKYAMGSQAIQEAKEGGFEDPLGAAANIGAAGVGAKLGNVAGARYGALGGSTASRVGKIAATEAGIEAVSGVPAAVVNSADLIAKAQSGGWDSLAPEEKSQLLAQVGASALASALGTAVGALSVRGKVGGDAEALEQAASYGLKNGEPIPQGAGTFPRGIFSEADAPAAQAAGAEYRIYDPSDTLLIPLGIRKLVDASAKRGNPLNTVDLAARWRDAGFPEGWDMDRVEKALITRSELVRPQGTPSRLTPQQRRQVETPEFEKWFGDWRGLKRGGWKKASKITENGEPMVLYHGTDADFTRFEERPKKNTYYQDGELVPDNDIGFFFSRDRSDASGFGPRVIPVFLRIANPKLMSTREYAREVRDAGGGKALREQLAARGYDGVAISENPGHDAPKHYIAFGPTQIKSATENIGTFDANNPDIHFSSDAEASPSSPGAQFAKKKPGTVAPTAQPRPPRIVNGVEYTPAWGDRLAIEPIPSSVAPSPDDAMGALAKALDKPVIRDKMPKGAGGYYEPGTGKVASGGPRDFRVITHELAHYLDDAVDLGFRGGPLGLSRSPASLLHQEVVPEFSRHGSQPPPNHPDPHGYLWHEGVAEFLMAWAFNPDQTRTLAPRMTQLFETKAPAPIRQALRTYGDSIRRYVGAPAASRMAANVRTFPEYLNEKNDPRPTWQKFVEGLADTMLDRNAPQYRALRKIMEDQGATPKEIRAALDQYRSARQRLYGVSGEVDETWRSGLLLDPVDDPGARATEGGIGWLFEPLLSGGDLKRNYDDALAVGLSRELKDRFVDIHARFDAALVRAQKRVAELTAQFNALDPDPNNAAAAKMRKALAARIFLLNNTAPAKINAQRRRAIESQFGGGLEILAEHGMPDAALKDVATDPERFARATGFADRYEQFAHGALAIMRKAGIIDDDTYDTLSAKPYMAMMRESEPYLQEKPDDSLLSVSHVPGTIQKLLHKAEGGRRQIVDPTIALMNFVDRAIVNSRKNEAMRLMVDQAIPKGRAGMYDGKARNLDKLAVRVKEPTDTSVTVFRNGKAEHWHVPADVHKALRDVGLANTNSFYRAARKIGQFQKWWITHGATFMLRQLLRDPFTRNFASTVDSGIFDAIPLLGRITESEDAFGNKLTLRDRVRTYSDAELAAARRAGIEQFGHHMTTKRSYAQAIADELAKMGADAGGAKFSLLNPVEVGKLAKGKLDDLARWSELTNRMAEFRAVFKDQVEKGVDPQDAAREAAFQARDLMDFAVAGSWAKNVNDFVLFFNAAIRGTAKTVQTFKRDPRKAATKLLLYMLPLEAAAYALNAMQGEEAIQEYNEFPDYRKDLFYMVRTGPSNWLVVPKPYELALASSAIRRAYQDAHGEPHAWEGFLGSALQTLSPIGVQETVMPFAGLQPFAQAATNRDFFRDRYIIPPHEEGLRMEKRDTSRASRLSKGVSDVFGNVGVELDPRMSDHVLRGLFSQYGDWALELSNLGRTDRPRTFGDRVRTLTGSTASTPGPVSESMQALMKRAEREGETNVAKMRNFTRLRDRYYQAATPEEREKAGRQMENLARRYLEIYERRGTLKTIE